MSDQLELWPDEAPGERLSWSWTRDRRLRDCARKYYLHHYKSRGGWQQDAPPEVRQAYVLRQLKSRHMWVGTVVHELIELALGAWRRGDSVSVDGLCERGTRRMRAQYAESVQGVYWDRPLAACGLVEHEYNERVTREEWQALRDRMERCVRGFFALGLVADIRKLPTSRWLALESLGSFDLDGATVVVKPDFAWRAEDGAVVIADWKTGMARPDEEQLQLATYGLYARRNWGVPSDGLRAVAVHLDAGGGSAVAQFNLGPAELMAAETSVKSSVTSMRALLPAAGEIAQAASFPMTDDLERCARCSFRRACGRQAARPQPAAAGSGASAVSG